nr:uncharacterized mitochondrial protein AtMg00810-like [Tanacetum cinerariifolium]
TNRVNAVSAPVNVVGPNLTNSTNSFNTASPSINIVNLNFGIARKPSFVDPSKYPNDLDMPELEDIVYSDDEEDVDPDYLDKVYKVVKALYGLHQALRARPDIIFAVCACARFQVTLKVLHLHAVKRIFRYLKGKPHLGLWYPRDSPFNLVAYFDSDYARASLDRKSKTGGCQFLVLIEAQQHISNESPLLGVNTPRCDKDSIELMELMVFMCLSTKRTAWNEFSYSMASAVICLAKGRKFNFSKYIFDSMVRNVDSPSNFLMYPHFLQVVMDNQVDDMTSYNTRYTSLALTQKVFANMRRVGKGFSGVKTPLFASMLVQPQPQAKEEEEEVEMPIASEQPTTTFESSVSLLTTLMETCATLSQKVAELEQDKHTQALEILQLKKRIDTIDVDEGITLVDVETQQEVVDMDDEPQGRINQEDFNAASNGVSAVESTVFDDEDVTMTMAQTLIMLKAEKAKLLDKQIAQKLHDKEVLKKPVSLAQGRKNMIIYLKNMAGYKMEHFRGMNYDKLRAAEVSGFESTQDIPSNDPKEMSEEDVQNMLKIVPVFEFKVETLQVKYHIIDWEIHTEGSRTYWKIIRVGGITEVYYSFEDMLKGFDKEELAALWNLVKEKFSSAVPSEDKEKALLVELKRLFEPDADNVLWKLQRYMHAPLTYKLYTNYGVHHVSSTRGHDIFMLTEKDYPLLNTVMILMLSGKLQVKEDNEMARDLVMKIFMETNKPKSKSLDTSSKLKKNAQRDSCSWFNITAAGSRLMLLEKVDAAAKVIEEFTLTLSLCGEEDLKEGIDDGISAVPSEDKEKALLVELKRLFKPDADDVLWKLQRYMHAPLTYKLYTNCGVHHVSSTRGHYIFMLTEKDYPLLNAVMILMLSGKLQVKEDNEMAKDLVMKIFMEANKPKSRSLDTSSK